MNLMIEILQRWSNLSVICFISPNVEELFAISQRESCSKYPENLFKFREEEILLLTIESARNGSDVLTKMLKSVRAKLSTHDCTTSCLLILNCFTSSDIVPTVPTKTF